MINDTVVVAIGGNALSPSGESAAIRNQFLHTFHGSIDRRRE